MHKIFFTTIIIILVSFFNCTAINYTFHGAISTIYSNPLNWSVAGIPPNPIPTGSNVYINAACVYNSASALTINGSLTINSTGDFTIAKKVILNGTMYCDNFITNQDTIIIGAIGEISNTGVFENSLTGVIQNFGVLYTTNIFNNRNKLYNNVGSFFKNGSIGAASDVVNFSNATISNAGRMENDIMSSIINNGLIGNTINGVIENLNVFTNSSTGIINNQDSIYNNGLGEFTNHNVINNMTGSVFVNDYHFYSNDTFINSGKFFNYNTASNTGYYKNTLFATLHNDNTFSSTTPFQNEGTILCTANPFISADFGNRIVGNGILSPGGVPGIAEINIANSSVVQDFGGMGLNFQIGGLYNYDKINTSGFASLNGASINVLLTNSYVPTTGSSFTLMTAFEFSTITPTFNLPYIAGKHWQKTYDFGELIITLVDNALPLNLISFDVEKLNEFNSLRWFTANEVNVSHFEIEQSSNGSDFEKVGTLQANNKENSSYHFTDSHPRNGTNYYRLKIVDYDGKYEYSPIRSIHGSGSDLENATIYPNPFQESLTIELAFITKAKLNLKILNSIGQDVYSESRDINEGINKINLSLAALQKGIYFLALSDGKKVITKRVVKQ